MRGIRWGILAGSLLLLGVARPLPGQAMDEDQMRRVFGGVEQWRGQIRVSWVVSTYFDDGVSHEDTYEDDSASATFVLDRVHSPNYDGLSWRSRPAPVHGQHVSSRHSRNGADFLDSSESGACIGQAVAEDIKLDVHWIRNEGARWDVSTGGQLTGQWTVRGASTSQGWTRPDNVVDHQTWERSEDSWPHTVLHTMVPSSMDRPGILVGQGGFDNSRPTGTHSYRTEIKRTRIVLAPEFDDVELIVDIEDYGDWMPRGRPDGGGPGSELTAFATLKPKAGRSLPGKPVKFRFELMDTSKEPGVCLNWPRLSEFSGGTPQEDTAFDLRFNERDGKLAGPEAQTLDVDRFEAVGTDAFRARATIEAFDYGGYGDLLVSAELPGGRIVLGRLKDSDETLIPVPKRRPGSVIADAYRAKWKCEDADGADDDAEPEGDGNKGDGFSAYEEYRGFVRGGTHVRTRPERKDLFIVNRVGEAVYEGLTCFTLATGLVVHDQTRREELTLDRVVNPNRSPRSPRASQELQHGLLLELRNDKSGVSMAEITGSFWRPKYTERVGVSAGVVGGAMDLTARDANRVAEDLASTVAHELCHSIGVRHHGNNDLRWVEFVRHTRASGEVVILERKVRFDGQAGQYVTATTGGIVVGNQVRVMTEAGGEIVPSSTFFDTPTIVYVACAGGEHSGNTDCVMRYNNAQWYVPDGRPGDRVFFRAPNPIGMDLCASPAAEGVWKLRFGDATKGDCQHRFAVRDDAPDVKK